ncbi:MAG: aryl-sulfate sulfotransferase, partial [Promethearchaeia archaeon]
ILISGNVVNFHQHFLPHDRVTVDTPETGVGQSLPKSDPKLSGSDGESIYLSANTELISNPGYFDGYNLFVLGRGHKTEGYWNYSLVIVDMEGNLVREKPFDESMTLANAPAEFINSTTILHGSPNGAALWNIYTNETQYLGFSGHHEYEYNPNDETYFTFTSYEITIDGEDYLFDKIVEYNENAEIVWELDTRSFISHNQWCPYGDTKHGSRDITHSNTIYFDSAENTIYYLSRNVNTFYEIDHATGEILWSVGEYGDFTQYDIEGYEKESLFYHAHAVEPVGDDTYIVFDNDEHNQETPLSQNSRIVEITLDHTTMTANETWVWEAPSSYWCIRWGDADKLANGNRLGTFGTEVHPDTDLGARLTEVNENGEIVWEMNFEDSAEFHYGVYRMERFRYTPILNSPQDMHFLPSEDVQIDWQSWYNFRPKRSLAGEYKLYLNESLIDEGTFSYDSYWRPRNLTFNFGQLDLGNYIYTLEISDEVGHTSSDSVNVTVASFFIDRRGPTEIELGQEETILRWFGGAEDPLNCNISLNGSLFRSFEWNGSDIELNLTILEVGSYELEFLLFNDTHTLYENVFWIHIYPNQPPMITVEPSDVSINWNESLTLSWTFFDHMPDTWKLTLNGSVYLSEDWSTQWYSLNWSIPKLDEASYEIRLEIKDQIGHTTTNSMILTIIPPSPPVISDWPAQEVIEWGASDTKFSWEVHGADTWEFWKNGTLIESGEFSEGHIVIHSIYDWQQQRWRPGTYNLTLSVASTDDETVSRTDFVQVVLDPGDPYADSVVEERSSWASQMDNAVGAPDGKFALIYLDYGNGFLTLDMGEGEEIVNEAGFDFTVVAEGAEYKVSVSNNLEASFTDLGIMNGSQQIDLDNSSLDSARYVMISYWEGTEVRLDAIVASHHRTPSDDTQPPSLQGPADFSILSHEQPITLTWNATDETPWDYTILVDGDVYAESEWYGNDIFFQFEWTNAGTVEVVLNVSDAFYNTAEDHVLIQIEPSLLGIHRNLALGLIIASMAIPVVVIFIWKRTALAEWIDNFRL